ncbi:MAG TPA: Gldg family protein, partial [Longimicrobiales bacterium]|nr:Gldg family protein [Longimicrobiales bacterium]
MTASRAPWWLTWLLVAGLLLVFLGERILAVTAVTWVGVGVVLASTLWRALAWRRAAGQARSMEKVLMLAHGGCLLALALYALGADPVLGAVGPDFATAEAEERFRAGLRVAWSLVLALSLLPILGAAWAVGMRRSSGEADAVEALRVRETAAGGLTLALAASALVLLGWVAQERDRTLDLSYFRTATPGSTTEEIVSSLESPLQVLVFFPQVNEVKDQVLTYFDALSDATDRVEIQQYDRVESPEVAREHRVTGDGTVILSSGEVEERLVVPTQLASARGLLRKLDSEVQNRLLRLLRGRRTIFLTVGHGELNDPSSAGPLQSEREDTGVQALEEILGLLNYDVEDLGIGSGLGREVPENAAAVLVLGPLRPFLDEELESLDAYLAGGGSLLLAVDPD